MDYPKHLSQKIREEVAVSYLKHELRKIFPSINTKEVEDLMKNKELCTPRDFWNGVHGIGMGFKLHIGFIYLVTAENIKWTKEKIKIDNLFFGAERKNTKPIRSKSVKTIKEYFKNNPESFKKAKNDLDKNWIDDKQREFDPIIVNEKDQGLSVYEGHNRLERFMYEGREEIDAYIGRYATTEKKPMNYWLPTSVVMDVLYYAYDAVRNNDDELLKKYAAVLNDMVKNSESGKCEFLERALTNKKEIREKILEAVKLR